MQRPALRLSATITNPVRAGAQSDTPVSESWAVLLPEGLSLDECAAREAGLLEHLHAGLRVFEHGAGEYEEGDDPEVGGLTLTASVQASVQLQVLTCLGGIQATCESDPVDFEERVAVRLPEGLAAEHALLLAQELKRRIRDQVAEVEAAARALVPSLGSA